MLRWLSMIALLSGCGGVASIDLTFAAPPPQQDGSTNFVFTVTEGSGTAAKILSSQILPFDPGFDGADIRLPFGGQRMVLATLETAEPPVRVLFSGRSGAFRLEDSDHPTIFITMLPSPAPGGIRVPGANAGRVATATVTLAIQVSAVFGFPPAGVRISDDPFFDPSRTDSHALSSLPTLPASVFEVSADYVLDTDCRERAGCPRTIYARFFDGSGFDSDVFTADLIYDPFPPRLIDASFLIDSGAALGTDGTAELIATFDEQVVVSAFASKTGGGSACPEQVELVDGRIAGLDFPLDCVGTYAIEITATDLAGNGVRLFDAATLAVDRLPPGPIDLGALTSSCAATQPLIVGAPSAAEARALVDADGVRARADERGAFVIAADPGSVPIVQIDAAGNESAAQTFEVMSCE